MNIVLIGYRGAGKSAVGRGLADRLRREFLDTDHLIEEQQGASIHCLVKSHGWERFRVLEKRVIREIARRDHLIIAPGGGAVLDPENIRSLKEKGLIIWLRAEPEILAERMRGDPQTIKSRPALTGKGALEEIQEVLSFRNPLYERAADAQVDTSNLDIDAVVERILSIITPSLERAHGRAPLQPFEGEEHVGCVSRTPRYRPGFPPSPLSSSPEGGEGRVRGRTKLRKVPLFLRNSIRRDRGEDPTK